MTLQIGKTKGRAFTKYATFAENLLLYHGLLIPLKKKKRISFANTNDSNSARRSTNLLAPMPPVNLRCSKTFISFRPSRPISVFVSMTRKSFALRNAEWGIGASAVWERSVPGGVGCRRKRRDGGEHKIHRVT